MANLENLQHAKDLAATIISDGKDRPAMELAEASSQIALQLIMEHLMKVDNLEGEKITVLLRNLSDLQSSEAKRESVKLKFMARAKKAVDKIEEKHGKSLSPEVKKDIREIFGLV